MDAPPRWSLEEYFPSIESPEFLAARGAVEDRLNNTEALFDEWKVGTGELYEEAWGAFDSATASLNELSDELRLIATYVNCFVDTDSRDQIANAAQSEIDGLKVRFSKLRTRWTRWAGALAESTTVWKASSAESHRYAIERSEVLARHQMSAAEEDLSAELQVSGSLAWEKLYGATTSQIIVDVQLPNGGAKLPMSAVRNLAYDASKEVREAAYHAEIAAWKANEAPIAACLNGIKGEFLTLTEKRKWESPLEVALFNANMDRGTLDAMMEAAKESFPAYRKYLRAKAEFLGYPGALPFHGLFAPVANSESGAWPYPRACDFIVESFEGYSSALADFARQALDSHWVDAEPRPGKADGGYCTTLKNGESRIFMNYKPSFGSVSTLAHELGHAYHNRMLRDRTMLQRQTPMTLAETASIFCETILRRSGSQRMDALQQFEVLEATLMGTCQTVVDITSRFLFESKVFEGRTKREMSASEFCDAMTSAQKQTYGDGLDPAALHPYMWAAKPHYYDGGYCFYNYPYMFGLLFGLGLYSVYEQEPAGFQERYDRLLSSTGLADAATCADWFGIDIRSIDFWRSSLKLIEVDIDRFIELASELNPTPA